jgi:hypothetical protein
MHGEESSGDTIGFGNGTDTLQVYANPAVISQTKQSQTLGVGEIKVKGMAMDCGIQDWLALRAIPELNLRRFYLKATRQEHSQQTATSNEAAALRPQTALGGSGMLIRGERAGQLAQGLRRPVQRSTPHLHLTS